MHHITLHTAFIFFFLSSFFSSFILSTIHQLTCGLFFVFFIFYHSLCLPHLLFCLYALCMYLLFYINIHLMCNYISSSGASSIEFFFFLLLFTLFNSIFFFHFTSKKYGGNEILDGAIR